MPLFFLKKIPVQSSQKNTLFKGVIFLLFFYTAENCVVHLIQWSILLSVI